LEIEEYEPLPIVEGKWVHFGAWFDKPGRVFTGAIAVERAVSAGGAVFIISRICEEMEGGGGLAFAGMWGDSARADAHAGKLYRNWISKGSG